jgi:hypothetical protein
MGPPEVLMKNREGYQEWLDAQHHHGVTAQRVAEQSALLAVGAIADMAATATDMLRILLRRRPHLTPLLRGEAAAGPVVCERSGRKPVPWFCIRPSK